MNCKKVCIVLLSIVLALVFSSCSNKMSESDSKTASTVGLSETSNESVSEVMSTGNNSEFTSEINELSSEDFSLENIAPDIGAFKYNPELAALIKHKEALAEEYYHAKMSGNTELAESLLLKLKHFNVKDVEHLTENDSEMLSTDNNSVNTGESVAEETTADIYSQYSEEESIEALQGYHSFVDSVEAKKVLAYSKVDIPETINDAQVWCLEMIDKSKVLVLLSKEDIGNKEIAEYGVYDFKNRHYKTFFKCDQKQDYEIVTLDEDYIVLRMSDNNWMNASTYLYSIRENALKKIFDNEKDKDTGTDVYIHDNNVVIKDNKIWLDKFYYDETNTLSVDMLSYDCATGMTTTVKKHAQNPMRYNGEIISFVKNADDRYKRLETLDGDLVCDIKEHLIKIDTSDNCIYCIENKYTDSKTMTTEFQIKDLIHGAPLFYTERAIGLIEVSDAFVSWYDFDVTIPCIYSVKNQCMLVFSELEQANNLFHIKDNYGLLSSYRDGKTTYYFFSEE